MDRIYLSLKEAASHLQAMGLRGQTYQVLLQAVHDGLLAAIKDGNTWRTTIAEVEAYRARLELLRQAKGRQERADLKQWLIGRDVIYEALPEAERRRRAKAYLKGERPTWK